MSTQATISGVGHYCSICHKWRLGSGEMWAGDPQQVCQCVTEQTMAIRALPPTAEETSVGRQCDSSYRDGAVLYRCMLPFGHSDTHESGSWLWKDSRPLSPTAEQTSIGQFNALATEIRRLLDVTKADHDALTEHLDAQDDKLAALLEAIQSACPPIASTIASATEDGKCGQRAEPIVPRLGISYACVLPKGHTGEHRGGGDCFAHGEYVGKQCPKWPECIGHASSKAARKDGGAKRKRKRR